MKRTIPAMVSIVLLAFCLAACGCQHEWVAATCTAPKTCSSCGQTEGDISQEHQWEEATCVQPKTCTDCGLTEGAALKHTFGEEEQQRSDYVTATVQFAKICSGCGIPSQERQLPMETFTDGTCFLMTPEEFCDRFCAMLQEMEDVLGEDQYIAKLYHDTDTDSFKLYIVRTDANDDAQIVGEFELYDAEGNLLLPEQKDDPNILCSVRGTVQDQDSAMLAALALWSTGDPADTLKDAAMTFRKLNALNGNQLDVHKKINMYSLPRSADIAVKVSANNDSPYELALNVR